MLQIALVYAGADAGIARRLGNYLERNARVRVDDSLLVTGDRSILDQAARAVGSDAAILFISPAAVPAPLDRGEWEPLLVEDAARHGAALAYVTIAPAPFPKVLLRGRSFDPGDARGLKRWLLGIRPPAGKPFHVAPGDSAATADEIEALRVRIADQPGSAVTTPAVARAFIDAVQPEFQGVVWVDAAGATLACATGELAAQLGLQLPGELPRNLDAIDRVLHEYRCLVVFENASARIRSRFEAAGLSSSVFVESTPPRAPSAQSARALLQSVAGWVNGRNSVPPSGRIRHTLEWLLASPSQWLLACDLARAAAAYLRFQNRLAEAFELVELILDHAIQRQDAHASAEFGRERGWILESWGRKADLVHPFAATPDPAVQLALW